MGKAASNSDDALSRSSGKGKTWGSVMKTTNPNRNELATAWLAATTTQTWEDFEAFASVLNTECKRQVPRGRLNGLMEGAENEVQQETCLILLGKFLIDNPHLIREQDIRAIERHLVQSIKICTRFAIARIARQRTNSRQFSTADESHYGTVTHPRCKTYADLTYDEKRALALATLQLAVEELTLSETNAQVAMLSPREAARRLGVSPSAIHQQLARVASTLAVLKHAVEIEIPQP
jgi:hypothetical protein